MTRRGSCLCGALRYEIDGEFDGVWMCHCSNCRKVSGGMGNTILIVPRARFRWLTGEDQRVTYAQRPTYTITRCKTCGTPLPAEEDATAVPDLVHDLAVLGARVHAVEPGRITLEERLLGILRAGSTDDSGHGR